MNADWPITHQKKTGQEGFAILEAMIAIMVFTIAILGVFSMQTSSVRANDIARGITTQSAIAAKRVEQLINLPFDHPDLTAGNHTDPNQDSYMIRHYLINWTVVDNDVIANTKTITLTVSWQKNGASKIINLTYVKPDTI